LSCGSTGKQITTAKEAEHYRLAIIGPHERLDFWTRNTDPCDCRTACLFSIEDKLALCMVCGRAVEIIIIIDEEIGKFILELGNL
jgi:hypothetical protein